MTKKKKRDNVELDVKTVRILQTIADALHANSYALLELAKLLKSLRLK